MEADVCVILSVAFEGKFSSNLVSDTPLANIVSEYFPTTGKL